MCCPTVPPGIYRAPGHGPAPHPEGPGPGDRRPAGRGVPGRRARPVRARPRQPVPAAGGHDPVGPDHRRERQQGHAGAVRPLPRRRPTWPRPTRRSSRRLIHPTGFFRAKARALLGMAAALEERFGGEVPTAMADLVTLPGRRPQDGQRGAQRGLRPARACRSTPTSAASPGAWGSPPRLDPVKVEAELERHGAGRRSGAGSACA